MGTEGRKTEGRKTAGRMDTEGRKPVGRMGYKGKKNIGRIGTEGRKTVIRKVAKSPKVRKLEIRHHKFPKFTFKHVTGSSKHINACVKLSWPSSVCTSPWGHNKYSSGGLFLQKLFP
jgi:hypothetical protein